MEKTTCSMCGHEHQDDGRCDCGCSHGLKKTCEACAHAHKDDNTCDCGCGK